MATKVKYYKKALMELKEERGELNKEFLKGNKYRSKMVRAISKVIKDEGLKTVPEIAERLDYTPNEIFLGVMYLMKYGGLKLVSKRGEYPEYKYGGH